MAVWFGSPKNPIILVDIVDVEAEQVVHQADDEQQDEVQVTEDQVEQEQQGIREVIIDNDLLFFVEINWEEEDVQKWPEEELLLLVAKLQDKENRQSGA